MIPMNARMAPSRASKRCQRIPYGSSRNTELFLGLLGTTERECCLPQLEAAATVLRYTNMGRRHPKFANTGP